MVGLGGDVVLAARCRRVFAATLWRLSCRASPRARGTFRSSELVGPAKAPRAMYVHKALATTKHNPSSSSDERLRGCCCHGGFVDIAKESRIRETSVGITENRGAFLTEESRVAPRLISSNGASSPCQLAQQRDNAENNLGHC